MGLRIPGRIAAIGDTKRELVAEVKHEVKILRITGARTIGGFLGDWEGPRDRRAADAAEQGKT